MSDEPNTPVPEPPDAEAQTRIGVDSWVAESEDRQAAKAWLLRACGARAGTPRRIRSSSSSSSPSRRPSRSGSTTGDLFIFGLFTLLYATLGLGLNVVVGFAGLLDLGYVAYFGIGAYGYALVSSPHYGIHWPTLSFASRRERSSPGWSG